MSSCECPSPPGGTVKCEDDQIAFCIVKNGKAIHQCITPIETRNSYSLVNWTLGQITGDYRSNSTTITTEDIGILEARKYESGSVQIRFALPSTILKALDEIVRFRNKGRRF